jgi:antitoxin component YwqK of YwqJK toxin-antitoxin module
VVTLPDGVVTAEGEFSAGNRVGRWIYRHPNGKTWKDGEYIDGKLHGTWRQYDMDGKSLGESRFDRGTGTETAWWDNGNVRQSIERKDGVADGKTTWYFETGEKLMEADYVGGKVQGTWTFWDSKGQTRKIETWEDGVIVNTVWYENGVPLAP